MAHAPAFASARLSSPKSSRKSKKTLALLVRMLAALVASGVTLPSLVVTLPVLPSPSPLPNLYTLHTMTATLSNRQQATRLVNKQVKLLSDGAVCLSDLADTFNLCAGLDELEELIEQADMLSWNPQSRM